MSQHDEKDTEFQSTDAVTPPAAPAANDEVVIAEADSLPLALLQMETTAS